VTPTQRSKAAVLAMKRSGFVMVIYNCSRQLRL
jgi:hypothetical protein